MDIYPDRMNHTSTEPGYSEALRAFFTRLVDSGKVTRSEGPALFDSETGQYLFEPYVGGGCPGCGNETSGNICEICGEPNFCVDLADPKSADRPGRAAPRHDRQVHVPPARAARGPARAPQRRPRPGPGT